MGTPQWEVHVSAFVNIHFPTVDGHMFFLSERQTTLQALTVTFQLTMWKTHSFGMIIFLPQNVFFWFLFVAVHVCVHSAVHTPLSSACNHVGGHYSSQRQNLCEKKKNKENLNCRAPPYLRKTGGSLSGFWCFIFRGNIWIQMNRGTQVYLANVCAEFNQSQVRSALSPSTFLPSLFFLISLQFTALYWHEW